MLPLKVLARVAAGARRWGGAYWAESALPARHQGGVYRSSVSLSDEDANATLTVATLTVATLARTHVGLDQEQELGGARRGGAGEGGAGGGANPSIVLNFFICIISAPPAL